MDFTASDEQAMLRDSARRYFSDTSSDRDAAWATYAELGWLALAVPEDAGGLGGDIEDILILAEEMGRGLARAPYVDSAILAMRLIDRASGGNVRRDLLSAIATGQARVAPALYEAGRRYSLEPTARATAQGAGYRLSGTKILVPSGGSADKFLVSALLDDGTIGLFMVEAGNPAVTVSAYSAIDDTQLADLSFGSVMLPAASLFGRVDIELIEDALDEARLALCADALGGLERAIG